MKKFSNKKKIILGSIIGVLVGTLFSVSYAMYTFSKPGITSQLVTGDIYMKYTEGSALNLSGVMPSSTYPTAATGNYFQFQIAGTNTSSGDISYNLKLVHGDLPSGKSESNRIGDQWLYFKLVEVSGNAETTLVSDVHFNSISNSLLHTMTVPAGTNSLTTRTFRLYARISETLGIGNGTGVTYSQSEWNNLFASIKVNAEGGYVEPTPVSAGCPGAGCYYSWNNSYWYTTWNTSSQTPTTIDPSNLPSGVSTNYNDVVQSNTFIAMKLNNSNQVEHAYACGIESGTPFCIEGTYSANPDKESIQQANLDILTPVFGSCSGTVDSEISCSGSLDAGFYSNGNVGVRGCEVNRHGTFYCID